MLRWYSRLETVRLVVLALSRAYFVECFEVSLSNSLVLEWHRCDLSIETA